MIHSLPHSEYSVKGLALLAGLLVVSCGSYQQASYYPNDGIYADDTGRVTVEHYPQTQQRAAAKDDDNVYGNYFGQKAEEYGEILDSEVFTDVDSYSAATAQDSLNLDAESDYYYDPNNTYQGYGGWGDNASSVTVNVYDGWGWGGYGYGLGYPWIGYYGYGFYNPWRYYGGYWGYPGYYGYGWGWGGYWGYNSWGWGGYWGYPGYWGGYYGYPYYRHGGYYGYGSYAYNRSRRGYYNSSLASNNLRGRSNLNTRSGLSDSRYRTNSGRSNLNTRSAAGRSSYKGRTNSSGRTVGVDGIARNESYRSARTTRAVPRYNSQSGIGRSYSSSARRSGTYSRGNTTARNGYSQGTYSRSATSRSSGNRYSSPSRSSGYRSSGSSGSYRSSRSSSPSRSSGYRSSGSSSPSRSSGSYRSSSAPSRSSGVRSSGSSGGRRNN